MIYFIKAGNLNQIKIGYSKNPKARFYAINLSSPINLQLIKTIQGEKDNEKNIHKKFSHIKVKGEWFQQTKELMDFIENITDFEIEKKKKRLIRNKRIEMSLYGNLIKIGKGSKGLIIPIEMLEYLNLDVGDAIKITIEKIEDIKPRKIEHKETEKVKNK